METILSRKWIAATVATWVIVIILDEFAYLVWKKVNPGSMWSGLVLKHPTQTWDNAGDGTSYPNGYRPAGGQ